MQVIGFQTVLSYEPDSLYPVRPKPGLRQRPKTACARPSTKQALRSRPQSSKSRPQSLVQKSVSRSDVQKSRPQSFVQNSRPQSIVQKPRPKSEILNSRLEGSFEISRSHVLGQQSRPQTSVQKSSSENLFEIAKSYGLVQISDSRKHQCSRPKSSIQRSRSQDKGHSSSVKSSFQKQFLEKSFMGSSRPKSSLERSRSQSSIQRSRSRPSTAGSIKYPLEGQGSPVRYDPNRPLDGDQRGLLGASINYGVSQPRATWSMADSQPKGESPLYGNTPRILELDINRMMIGQNTISAQIGAQSLSNDRLVNAANSNLRSYMTVNRPSGQTERPSSASRKIGSPAPSISPTNQSASSKRVRMSADIEVPSVMATPPPLPPIASGQNRPSSGTSRQTPTRIPSGDVPPSPPGSSLRHTPPGDFSEAPPTN